MTPYRLKVRGMINELWMEQDNQTEHLLVINKKFTFHNTPTSYFKVEGMKV